MISCAQIAHGWRARSIDFCADNRGAIDQYPKRIICVRSCPDEISVARVVVAPHSCFVLPDAERPSLVVETRGVVGPAVMHGQSVPSRPANGDRASTRRKLTSCIHRRVPGRRPDHDAIGHVGGVGVVGDGCEERSSRSDKRPIVHATNPSRLLIHHQHRVPVGGPRFHHDIVATDSFEERVADITSVPQAGVPGAPHKQTKLGPGSFHVGSMALRS